MKRNHRRLSVYLSWGISITCLWLIFCNIDIVELSKEVFSAHAGYVVLSMGMTLLGIAIRAWRWKYLFPVSSSIHYSDLLIATGVGMMANNILPARIGEVVRAFVLGRRSEIGVVQPMTTIVVERVLDISVLLAILGIVIIELPLPKWIAQLGLIVLALDVLLIATLATVRIKPGPIQRLVSWLTKWLPPKIQIRIMDLLEDLLKGLRGITSWRRFFALLAWSAVLWGVIGASVASALTALGLSLDVFQILVVVVVLSLGLIVPSGPGSLGTFELFAASAVGAFGISQESALSFAVLYHAIIFIPTVLFGIMLLWIGNVRLARQDLSPEA